MRRVLGARRPARRRGAQSRWTALNACLVPALALDGQEVVTAEGLGTPGDLHPVQEEMACRGGSQCGYCTPGFICSMAAEYYRPERTASHATAHVDAEHGPNGFDLHALSGNLCRCTGYRPIRDAAYALGSPPADDALAGRVAAPRPAAPPTRVEPVRPAHRPRRRARAAGRAPGRDGGGGLHRLGRRGQHPRRARPVRHRGGPADRAADVRRHRRHTSSSAPRSPCPRPNGCWRGRVPLLDALWPQFASRLIRNGATIGGNLGTGSPIGDAPPALLALRASVVLVGPDGERVVPFDQYFTGYRRSVREAGELIKAVRGPVAAGPAHRVPQDRQAAVRRHLQRRGGVRARRAGRGRRRRRHRPRRGRGHAGAGDRHRGGARRQAVGRRHRVRRPRPCSARRAPPSTTTAPAPPSGWRCSNSRS